jgi:hypothetical protein
MRNENRHPHCSWSLFGNHLLGQVGESTHDDKFIGSLGKKRDADHQGGSVSINCVPFSRPARSAAGLGREFAVFLPAGGFTLFAGAQSPYSGRSRKDMSVESIPRLRRWDSAVRWILVLRLGGERSSLSFELSGRRLGRFTKLAA